MSLKPSAKKKNPFQRFKEEEEAKKKKAEDEAAAVYAEFVESFKDDDHVVKKGKFMRGETVVGERVASSSAREEYRPTLKYSEDQLRKNRRSDESRQRPQDSAGRKKRALDELREEFQKKEEQGSDRSDKRSRHHSHGDGLLPPPPAHSTPPTLGLYDRSDSPRSTNLYVGNLAPDVTEELLFDKFSRFGPIASVKIMWPRSDEEHRRGRNCGFVAFMKRTDASNARENLQNLVLHGLEVQVGWGKPVSLPARALTHPPRPPPQLAHLSKRQGITHPPSFSGPQVLVSIPEDPERARLISKLADYIVREGAQFEQMIMQREKDNPKFSFLFQVGSSENNFYRWKVWSLTQGDSDTSWSTEPFQMLPPAGPWWIPPHCPGQDSKETARLPAETREQFEDLLHALTAERELIKEGMVFAVEQAEFAFEIADILTESLTIPTTPLSRKLARLYLVSDILYNSGLPIPHVSLYRTRLEESLPLIFEGLLEVYSSISGRITAKNMKERVLKVLHMWEHWSLFPMAFLEGLKATFLSNDKYKEDAAQDDIDGVPLFETPALPTKDLASLDTVELERLCKTHGQVVDSREKMIDRLRRIFAPAASVKGAQDVIQSLNDLEKEFQNSSAKQATAAAPAGSGTEPAVSPSALGDEDVDGEPLDDIDGVPL
mmetsp:Transcript_45673/g.114940  ORF Transcript_45673/g.114940 Transcript_45673/m.114940 type:complete len:661 (-) Transcript_45673:198-2180(-)